MQTSTPHPHAERIIAHFALQTPQIVLRNHTQCAGRWSRWADRGVAGERQLWHYFNGAVCYAWPGSDETLDFLVVSLATSLNATANATRSQTCEKYVNERNAAGIRKPTRLPVIAKL